MHPVHGGRRLADAAAQGLAEIVADWEAATGAEPVEVDGARVTSARCA